MTSIERTTDLVAFGLLAARIELKPEAKHEHHDGARRATAMWLAAFGFSLLHFCPDAGICQ